MNIRKFKNAFNGLSSDSIFLIFVRVVTIILGLAITRLLSQHFSVFDYGTYSQITLIVSSISSITILGMMDGVNFFFCKEQNIEKRNSYVSTIFSLQYVLNIIVAIVVLCCAVPVSRYFGNEALKSLLIFAAVLPVLQNSISILQILFVAIGKAKLIAVRNFVVSAIRLVFVYIACYLFDSIVVILISTVLLDILQIIYFLVVLRKNDCKINLFRFDGKLVREILAYCIPMAMFTIVSSLNRDCDKYVISAFTDTENLAIYTNASKVLPFDIIMASFCTVILPHLTRFISKRQFEKVNGLYKSFLEIAYVSTTILAVGALCVPSELMTLLYTDKYLAGLNVFVVYILVDIVRFLGVTMILSALGKTKTILFVSIGTLALNCVLNIPMYLLFGNVGPAIATLIVTLLNGLVLTYLSAKNTNTSVFKFFDCKYLAVFLMECVVVVGIGILMEKICSHFNF